MKLLMVYAVWMLIYTPFYLFHFKDSIEVSIITNLLNLFFGFWHLWYVAGLLGGVIILYILKKRLVKDHTILIISLVLFLIGWCIQKIELFYPNSEGLLGSLIRSSYPSRNFIFMGFPFVALGYFISKIDFMPKLKSILSNKKVLLLLFLALFIETTIHFYIIGRRGFDFYLILFFLCPSLILIIQKNSKIIEVKDDFISKLSAAIYFIHPLVLFLIKETFKDLNNNAHYIVIAFFSIIFGSALIYANKRLKIFF